MFLAKCGFWFGSFLICPGSFSSLNRVRLCQHDQFLNAAPNMSAYVAIAGVLYMKKMMQYWAEGDEAKPTDPPEFIIHENDKQLMRDNIVEAVIATGYPLRSVHLHLLPKSEHSVMTPDLTSYTAVSLKLLVRPSTDGK